MITYCDLQRETEAFFKLYWKPEFGQLPTWSEYWYFEGAIPQNTQSGCYTLFKGNDIIYIGAGLGDQLKKHWRVNKDDSGKQYCPTEDWKEVTSIITIGIGEDHFPLAAALEVFLIDKLNPARNSQRKK